MGRENILGIMHPPHACLRGTVDAVLVEVEGRGWGSTAVPMGKQVSRPDFKSQHGHFSAG